MLQEHGFSEEQLQELEGAVLGEGGLSWGALLQRVRELKAEMAAADLQALDVSEKRQLQVLLQKMGIPAQEAQRLAEQGEDLDPQKLRARILEALEALPKDAELSVAAEELSILAHALGLSGSSFGLMGKIIASEKSGSLSLSAEEGLNLARVLADRIGPELAELLSAGREQVLTLGREAVASLRQALGLDGKQDGLLLARLFTAAGEQKVGVEGLQMLVGVMGQARQRLSASEKDDLDALLAKLGGIRAHGRQKEMAQSGDVPEGSLLARTMRFASTAQEGDETAASRSRDGAESKDGEANLRLQATEQQARGRHSAGAEAETSSDRETNRDAAGDLWSRIQNRSAGQASAGKAETSPTQAAGGQPQGMVADAARPSLQTPEVSRSVYRMVESGIFQNLGQGRRQLTLRLTPPELGSLSVMLQVKDKDVQAVIRTSSDDAGRIIGEQLAQLRQSLESQGLKVSRLEVQTQLREQLAGNGWLGAEGHNQAQEQHQQFEGLGWIRRWFGMRQAGGEETAQGLQTEITGEQISSDGLDIFA